MKKERSSNFELMRIILMMGIIAHHYVVNSGILNLYDYGSISKNMIFSQWFGMFGKIAINGFTFLTGYYMVKSTISLRKFLKVFLEIEFYYISAYFIFCVRGYALFNIEELMHRFLFFIYEAGDLYTGSYICFFVCIPFINILLNAMDKKQMRMFILVGIIYYTIFSTLFLHNTFNFVGWLGVAYSIGAYLRLYGLGKIDCIKWGIVGTFCSLILMQLSVLYIDFFYDKSITKDWSFLMGNCHMPLAISFSLFLFLIFKNWKIKFNPVINSLGGATFGILLFHTNSGEMRVFLWQNLFKNCEMYFRKWFCLYAIAAVVIVFSVGYIIEKIRMVLFEKNIFKLYDKYIGDKG